MLQSEVLQYLLQSNNHHGHHGLYQNKNRNKHRHGGKVIQDKVTSINTIRQSLHCPT